MTVLVTGANRGIGHEIVLQLASMGHRVVLTSRFAEKGEAVVADFQKKGLDVSFVQLDVSDRSSLNEAFNAVSKKIIKLDVLINNAGILIDGSEGILDISDSKIYSTFQTNATGALLVSRTFLPLMKKGSRIINISSGAGAYCGEINDWAPIYSISKTLMNCITRHLSAALEPQGIPVNAVCPGWVRTGMGGGQAPRSVAEGAETPVWLATEASTDLTGKFLRDKKVIPW